MKPEHKEDVCHDVVERVFEAQMQRVQRGEVLLETIINDTIYHEKKRLHADPDKKALKYWKSVNKRFLLADRKEQESILKELIKIFIDEIVGHFDEKVYRFSTNILPVGLGILLNTISPRVLLSKFPRLPDLRDSLLIHGEIELLRELEKKGTVILLPTHSSNMDSIIIGFALYKIGLQPFTYGAGINLFTNWIVSYFMNNLGAYKVDRKKKAALYKDILKEYATVTIEYGYNNLFFPGGTRSRSGAIEDRLKLGLLGSGLKAYINNLKNNKEQPKIFIIPCTISYELVLEAEGLSKDFLRQTGGSKFIIQDDEFSRLGRMINFVSSTLSLDSRIYVNICPAMDFFGNRVDKDGVSYDKRGRKVDIERYVFVDGQVDHLKQRDEEYVRQLGTEIVQLYKQYNMALSTNILASVIYKILLRDNPQMDFYRLLFTGGEKEYYTVDEVLEPLKVFMVELRKLEEKNEIFIDERLKDADAEVILNHALKRFRVYHNKPSIIKKNEKIYINNCNLIYYYNTRLMDYGIEIQEKNDD
ncbi:1-acyl-sn-glycerol-3-phosphate acyltransferase [Candidatus Uabimicrobium sp. HlEnr_7]|uniref:1-acyl-sn-glycerol-3-phosphate acyltransferase n=1 Tax=Candidatus Uabimicrobium helgolandensis TaxID=3095367 RepID=UPI003558CC69